MKFLKYVLPDISPLKESRDYRLLWSSTFISETGRQITLVAIFIQVYEITGSPAIVGAVGAAQFVALLLTTVLAGPLVDRMDRRLLLLWAQIGYALVTGVLVVGAAMQDTPIALVFVAAAVASAIGGIAAPTRSAMVANVVPIHGLANAQALNQVMWNATMIVGPALGGFVIQRFGLAWGYGLDLVTYAATITAATLMKPLPPSAGEHLVPDGFAAVKESFSFLRTQKVLQSTFAIDLVAMIFGMPRALFPILAVQRFGGDAQTVGLLFAAPAAGALLGALTAGWVGQIKRQGLAVISAVAVWGAGIVAFGLTRSLVPALCFLAVAGAADVISAVFRSTILQTSVPDHLRGRLSAVNILVVAGGPRLGDVEAGLVAQMVSPVFSVVSGGLACLFGTVVVAAVFPQLRRYRKPPAADPKDPVLLESSDA